MSVSVDTKGLIDKVFANFKKITPALIAIVIASGLILFLPESILEKMALNNLNDIWKIVISLIFLISLALIITIAFVEVYRGIKRKLTPKRFRRMMRRQFVDLPLCFKKLIVSILNSPNRSMRLDPTSGDTLYLQNSNFIYQAQSFMFAGPDYTAPVPYAPQPWLIDLYNEEPDLFKI